MSDRVTPPPPALPACLDVLARAREVRLGPTGFVAKMSDEARAYEEALRLGADARAPLVWMARHANSSGRVYAGLLLDRIDNAEAAAVWRELLTKDEEIVVAPGGCVVFPGSVSRFARSMLEHGNLLGPPIASGGARPRALASDKAVTAMGRTIWPGLTASRWLLPIFAVVALAGVVCFLVAWLRG